MRRRRTISIRASYQKPTEIRAALTLARQLEDLLDGTPFDIATLSRSPEGATEDGLSATPEHLLILELGSKALQLQLDGP